ncbi:MAG: UDP-3-O-(3-hydroxymyristoyl)glucosamine N-acyltransferase [Pseudomonadota bacterium]
MKPVQLIPPRTLSELAEHAVGVIRSRLAELGSPQLAFKTALGGDPSAVINYLCPVDAIRPGSLTFAVSRSYLERVEASEAAAVIVPPGFQSAKPYLQAPEPRLVFTVILELALDPPSLVPGRPDNLRFKDRRSVDLGEQVIIGDYCYLGARVKIGRGTRIYPQVFIDDDVEIGDECIIYPQVSLFRRTILGRKVIIHSGTVIGDDGFGYNQIPNPETGRLHHLKNEHLGGVVIEDQVEVGSCVCIDRGLAGMTRIGFGTKIDNQVQIAHNVEVGSECIIVSQAGIAGNSKIGNRVFLLARAGVTTGVRVGDEAIVAGMAGVTGDLPPGRTVWGGIPAQRHDDENKQKALARRELPRLREFMRLFKKAESFEELKAAFFKKDDS